MKGKLLTSDRTGGL